MSIASEISRLQNDSSAIASAIRAKGVTVPSGAGYDDYASLIGQISSGGGGGRLPSGYTELDYVQTDSVAYVDTGVAGATDLEITAVYSWHSYVQYGYIYGNYVSESAKSNRVLLMSQSAIYVAGGNSLATQVNNSVIGAIHTLVVRSNEAYLNGIRTAISAGSQSANSTNIALGKGYVTSTTVRDLELRIYSFAISKNGSQVLNYVPCLDSNSVAGFYDLINDVFKPSASATAFVAGPIRQ